MTFKQKYALFYGLLHKRRRLRLYVDIITVCRSIIEKAIAIFGISGTVLFINGKGLDYTTPALILVFATFLIHAIWLMELKYGRDIKELDDILTKLRKELDL